MRWKRNRTKREREWKRKDSYEQKKIKGRIREEAGRGREVVAVKRKKGKEKKERPKYLR